MPSQPPLPRPRPDFEASVLAFLPNLYRFALSLTRRLDTAEELVQITVERAITAQERLGPDARLEAWLLRILRNAWIDMTRRTRTRGTEVDLDDAPEADQADGPRVTEARLMLVATERALASLPADQREIVALVCYEELSYAEAAEVLGIPIGTVMSRLSRARVALARKLGID